VPLDQKSCFSQSPRRTAHRDRGPARVGPGDLASRSQFRQRHGIRTALGSRQWDVIVIQDADFEYDRRTCPGCSAHCRRPGRGGHGVRSLHPGLVIRLDNRFVTLANLLYRQRQATSRLYKMMRREIAQASTSVPALRRGGDHRQVGARQAPFTNCPFATGALRTNSRAGRPARCARSGAIAVEPARGDRSHRDHSCLQRGRRLAHVVRWRAAPLSVELLVVDDGSQDETTERPAQSPIACAIPHARPRRLRQAFARHLVTSCCSATDQATPISERQTAGRGSALGRFGVGSRGLVRMRRATRALRVELGRWPYAGC
jgi:hypothetical protein